MSDTSGHAMGPAERLTGLLARSADSVPARSATPEASELRWAIIRALFLAMLAGAWMGAVGAWLYLAWLAKYQTHEDAGRLYRAWLALNGPVDVVEPFLLSWLGQHEATEIGQVVAEAYRSDGILR